jgi:predicted NAD/FAD-dependent oxidoreductase
LQFDHGLQFVRPVTDTFKAICEEWLAAGALAPWEQDAVVRYDASSGKVTPRTQWQQQQQQGAASDVG